MTNQMSGSEPIAAIACVEDVAAAGLLTFGSLLDLAGIARSSVRLLRHQDNRYTGYQSPYVL